MKDRLTTLTFDKPIVLDLGPAALSFALFLGRGRFLSFGRGATLRGCIL